jgi:phage/plasmid primase-like uncharacterized protein
MNVMSEFIEAMADHDLDPGDIIADGIIHRFPTWGDKSGEASGAYWHNGNVGWFQDHRTMKSARIVKGTLSEADKEALKGSFNGNGQKVSREALEAGIREIWQAGTKPEGHPYLLKKQIPVVHGIKQYDGKLIIPLFGIDGELNGLQNIDADGRKLFLTGTRKRGSFFSIVGSETVVICEGFATGVSIHEATGYSITVALDAGNLEPVAKQICNKVGSDKVIVAGDRDSWKIAEGKRDVGTESAKKAAAATGARLVFPVFQKADGKRTTDFNDLFIAEGADAVKAQIKTSNTGGVEVVFDSVEPIDIFGDATLTGRPTWPDNACPQVIDNFARDAAERIGVDVEMVALPSVICAAIGIPDNYKIQPKLHDTSWTEAPRLWGAVIAKPGQKKTPALLAASKPIKELQFRYRDEYQEKWAVYERNLKLFELEPKNKRAGKDKPEPPKMRRIWTDELTVESLRETLKENPLGVGIIKDELSGWITAFDAYKYTKKGSADRPHFCELYQGGPKVFDRVSNRNLFVENWGASIIGGIQPGPVQRLMGNITDDGLIARFIFCHAGRSDQDIDRAPHACCETYSQAVKQLPKLKPQFNNTREVFTFDETGIEYRKQISNTCRMIQILPETGEALAAHLNKWEAIFARISLVYHILESVARGKQPDPRIDPKVAEMAGRLMIDFLLPNSIRFYNETIDDGSHMGHAKWVAGYILSRKIQHTTPRDLQRSYRPFRNNRKTIFNPMHTLYLSGWVQKEDHGKRITWHVNPMVHDKFAEQAKLEKDRREKERLEVQNACKVLGLNQSRKRES